MNRNYFCLHNLKLYRVFKGGALADVRIFSGSGLKTGHVCYSSQIFTLLKSKKFIRITKRTIEPVS